MTRGRALVVVLGVAGAVFLAPGVAAAHPLGNFTVNHSDALLLRPDGVELTAVVDRAEIPATQALQDIAPDGDPSEEVLSETARTQCAALAGDVHLAVDGTAVAWTVTGTALEVLPGAAGLPTLRLTCELRAEADLSAPAIVTFRDDHASGPVGWREITADGEGVRLVDSPVPVESVSDQLRSYPDDMLSSPLDVRSLEVSTEPGENTGGGAPLGTGSGDPFGATMASLDRWLQDLVGDDGLTPLVGVLAVALAVLLGCGHALLPGHGKTVMAAYLAGRRGRPRDAVLVGATVTATHTVGVLVLGLAVSLSSSFAGDQVLRWLGVASGVLVALIGGAMLRGALRTRRADVVVPVQHLPEPALAVGVSAFAGAAAPGAVRSPAIAPEPDHGHDPSDGRRHGHHGHPHHGGDHHDRHRDGHGHHGHHDDDLDHHHDDSDHHRDDHDHHHDDHGPRRRRPRWSPGHVHGAGGHVHGPGGHVHGPGGHVHGPAGRAHGSGRGALVGMGIAGGLVPSPSALVVLMASIGLGRTVFGVVLVLAYGLGMAATLIAVGLTLVHLRDRLARRLTTGVSPALRAVARAAPVLTAALVLVVGLALVVRGASIGA